ncbi:carboxypeptidase M32 [Desertibaculum subflavum]|uniref:carboxypeptidase M32 n=1 Tax=Desertibaculum subflavum TaxID=2268458 RepID=UPI000E664AF4
MNQTAYAALETRFRRIAAISGALGILDWDQAVMMPPGGAAARAEQIATLGVLRHELLTAAEIGDLAEAAAAEPLDDWQSANLREMRRARAHAMALPPDLVERRAHCASSCEIVWREARAKSDFKLLAPKLAELLDLTREAAAAKSAALGLGPYDALLDEFEPEAREAQIAPVFEDLAGFLPGFIGEALEKQTARPAPLPLPGPFPVESQRALGLEMMQALGFAFDRGRLDVSLHPFTGGGPQDVRITTRYAEEDFFRALMGVLHETGHALYELGLPAAWTSQPVGQARGMVLHESQSLLVEMQVCRSDPFLRFAAPLIAKSFGRDGEAFAAPNLASHARRVSRGLIRVDADEATYPLHIILRFRLERALLDRALGVDELPVAWNDMMRELVGAVPPNDALGCLQDIHWPSGAFGYFPTYTLGALSAAQLYAAARAADSGIEPAIERGEFAPLLAWLRANVHGHGSRLTTDEVLRHATGAPLSTTAFKRHLQQRYLS